MSDEPKQPDAPEAAAATTAEPEKGEQSEERRYTGSDVERIVRERLDRDRKSREKEPKAPPKEEKAKAGNDDVSEIKERMAFQDSLDDLTDELDWKPTKGDRALLRSMFKAGGAEQMAALAERLRDAGKKPDPGTAPAAAAQPAATYRPPPGAPNSPADIIESNPAKWTRSHIDRLRSDGTFKQELEKHYGTGQGGLFRRHIPNVR